MSERTPLEMAMFAAWLGVTPEQVPATYAAHTCADTMARWKRVGEAAIAFLASAIEARSDETRQGLGPQGESAMPQADPPTPSGDPS